MSETKTNICEHCGTTESEQWHPDSAGLVLCGECFEAYAERIVDDTQIGHEAF